MPRPPRLTDTSPDAQRVLDEVYRTMPPARKWAIMAADFRFAKLLHASAIRRRHPQATSEEIRDAWITDMVGDGPWRNVVARKGFLMDQPAENLAVIRDVIAILKKLNIPHAVGGSIASSYFGIARFTRDADLTVDPFPGQESVFANSFGSDYYVSEAAVRDAVRHRSSFNIIQTLVGFKVDVFVKRDRPFEQAVMQRRLSCPFPDVPDQTIDLISPEDIILHKLEWYRLGGETSDRQWSDVVNVLRVQAGRLDEAHLDHWAAELGVSDLLDRAREDASI